MKTQIIFAPTDPKSNGKSTAQVLGTTADQPSDGRAADGALRALTDGAHDAGSDLVEYALTWMSVPGSI